MLFGDETYTFEYTYLYIPMSIKYNTSLRVWVFSMLKCPKCGHVIKLKCKRCGYEWTPRSNKLPEVCPNRKCKSPYWNKERVRKDFKKPKKKGK